MGHCLIQHFCCEANEDRDDKREFHTMTESLKQTTQVYSLVKLNSLCEDEVKRRNWPNVQDNACVEIDQKKRKKAPNEQLTRNDISLYLAK